MHKSLRCTSVLALASALAGCGGDGSENQLQSDIQLTPENPISTEATKTLAFTVDVSAALNAGVSASRVEVRVFNDLLERQLTADITEQTAAVSFSELPLGSYSISVAVYDGEDLIATGSGSAQVTADSTTTVSLLLSPLTGGLDVAICLPDIATQYFNGSGSGELVHIENPALEPGDEQPAAQVYHSAMDAISQLTFDYRVGDGVIPIVGENELIPLHTDHGARLIISDGDDTLMELAGCNTQLLVSRNSGRINLWYVMPEAYHGEIDVQMQGMTLGSIISEHLAMVVTLTDSDGDAGISSAETLSDIDFARLEEQKLTLGVPLPSEFTGMTGLLLSEPDSMIEQALFYSHTR